LGMHCQYMLVCVLLNRTPTLLRLAVPRIVEIKQTRHVMLAVATKASSVARSLKLRLVNLG